MSPWLTGNGTGTPPMIPWRTEVYFSESTSASKECTVFKVTKFLYNLYYIRTYINIAFRVLLFEKILQTCDVNSRLYTWNLLGVNSTCIVALTPFLNWHGSDGHGVISTWLITPETDPSIAKLTALRMLTWHDKIYINKIFQKLLTFSLIYLV